MSRRFSDEPINLIHRIPTPEQLLEAARPSQRSWYQVLIEAGARWIERTAAVIRPVIGSGTTAETTRAGQTHDKLDSIPERTIRRDGLRQAGSDSVQPTPGSSGTAVHPEEVAELRAYILSQQHDIARLSAQVQELKSMLVSQQQVLVYLGKELEAAPTTAMTGVASAPAKRNRAGRDKSFSKDTAVPRKDAQNPSLSL
jgi:hypothetical protein